MEKLCRETNLQGQGYIFVVNKSHNDRPYLREGERLYGQLIRSPWDKTEAHTLFLYDSSGKHRDNIGESVLKHFVDSGILSVVKVCVSKPPDSVKNLPTFLQRKFPAGIPSGTAITKGKDSWVVDETAVDGPITRFASDGTIISTSKLRRLSLS